MEALIGLRLPYPLVIHFKTELLQSVLPAGGALPISSSLIRTLTRINLRNLKEYIHME